MRTVQAVHSGRRALEIVALRPFVIGHLGQLYRLSTLSEPILTDKFLWIAKNPVDGELGSNCQIVIGSGFVPYYLVDPDQKVVRCVHLNPFYTVISNLIQFTGSTWSIHPLMRTIAKMQLEPKEGVWGPWPGLWDSTSCGRSWQLIRTEIATLLHYGCHPSDLVVLANGHLSVREDYLQREWSQLSQTIGLQLLDLAATQTMTEKQLAYCLQFGLDLVTRRVPLDQVWQQPFMDGLKPEDFPLRIPHEHLAQVAVAVRAFQKAMMKFWDTPHELLARLWSQARRTKIVETREVASVPGLPPDLDFVMYPTKHKRKRDWSLNLFAFRLTDYEWTNEMTAVVIRTMLEVQNRVLNGDGNVLIELSHMVIAGNGTVCYKPKGDVATYEGWESCRGDLADACAALVDGNLYVSAPAKDFIRNLREVYTIVAEALTDPFICDVPVDKDARGKLCCRLCHPRPEVKQPAPSITEIVEAGVKLRENFALQTLYYALVQCREGRNMPKLEHITYQAACTWPFGRRDVSQRLIGGVDAVSSTSAFSPC